MSKDKYIITQIVNRKPIPMPTSELKEDGMFLNIHENIISQIVEAKNNREFEFVCSQIQNFIEENNIGVCFAINKSELTDCLQEHQKLKFKISDLEAKLAEKEEDLQATKESLYASRKYLDEETSKRWALEKQLAEKDKLLREKIGSLKTTDFIRLCLDCGFMVDAKDKDNQDKISFAVEQLEKVRECFIDGYAVCKNFSDLYWNFTEQIDNQIKQLKEMK